MKYICSLISLIYSNHSQSQIAIRKVMDRQTQLGVSYATIKILNSTKGAIASDKGEFELNIESADSVLISSVGFVTKVLPGKDIGNIIYLDAKVKTLDDVRIQGRKWSRTVILGNGVEYLKTKINCHFKNVPDSKCWPWGPSGNKEEFAERIELPNPDFLYKIKKIFLPVIKGSCWGDLLLHIYAEDSVTGRPGEELLLKPVNVTKVNVAKTKCYWT